jgi:large subunit ribosomal protein L29
MANIKELRGMAEQDLRNRIADIQTGLMKDYTQVATGTVPKNPGKLRNNRKLVARILTILREKDIIREKNTSAAALAGKPKANHAAKQEQAAAPAAAGKKVKKG